MSQPKRIYCKVVGCLTRETADVEIIGGPGVPPESFHPHPVIRISTDLVPCDKRFPNSIIWFDVGGDKWTYVKPLEDETS
jgi:hypothetical protein